MFSNRRRAAIAALALACASAVAAEPALSRAPVMNLEAARHIVAAAEAEARRLHAPGAAIAIADAGGNLVLLERLDGTFSAGSRIAFGKARTAAQFAKPTRALEEIVNGGRTAMVALEDFTPLQGGVPILVDGHLIGAIGVSGAMSAEQDSAIAEAAALDAQRSLGVRTEQQP